MSLHTERYRKCRWGSLALAALLAACGGGGGGDSYSGGGTPNPAPPVGIPNLQATFASIQANVFTPICTACHVGATAPQGLVLDAASSYALLVGVASTEQPSILRVAPGNPGASYLIQKLEGTAAVGGRMPLNGTPLVQSDINIIRQWITDGAQGPPPPPANNPIRVSSLSPVPESSATALPSSITAVFDRELNAATVTTATFLVDRSGGDGSFAEGNEVAITAASITVPAANPSSAVFGLSGVASVEDTYRVRLIGAGAANILDLAGNALDGEFSGAFPSGNGTAGGDFTRAIRRRKSAADATVTADERVRAALLGMSHGTNVETAPLAGGHGSDERRRNVRELGRRRKPRSTERAESAGWQPGQQLLGPEDRRCRDHLRSTHAARRPVPRSTDDRRDSTLDQRGRESVALPARLRAFSRGRRS